MTLNEIEMTLPNGFHDAEVSRLSIDYLTKTASIELHPWVGSMDAPSDCGRELYRPAVLVLKGIIYLSIDPPDPRYPYDSIGSICIDLCDSEKTKTVRELKSGEFSGKFFVVDWNTFITFIASDAELLWQAEAYERKENEGSTV
jgi:hypothetical protein